MTSLKVKDANEIVEAMAKALGGDFLKTAAGAMSLELLTSLMHSEYMSKKAQYDAMGPDKASEAVAAVVWNANLSGIQAQENVEPGFLQKAADLRDSYMVPSQSADDVQNCDEGCECPKCAGKEAEPMDEKTAAAVTFAMNHLVKVADALDKGGFAGVAGLVDETINKLAGKKSK